MKKIIIAISIIVLIVFVIILLILKNDNKEINNNTEIVNTNTVQNTDISNNTIIENRVDEEMDTVYIKVNNKVLNIELEDNSATKELRERLKNGDVIVNAHEYGGFEKVGDLGFSLPREIEILQHHQGILFYIREIKYLYFIIRTLGVIQN